MVSDSGRVTAVTSRGAKVAWTKVSGPSLMPKNSRVCSCKHKPNQWMAAAGSRRSSAGC